MSYLAHAHLCHYSVMAKARERKTSPVHTLPSGLLPLLCITPPRMWNATALLEVVSYLPTWPAQPNTWTRLHVWVHLMFCVLLSRHFHSSHVFVVFFQILSMWARMVTSPKQTKRYRCCDRPSAASQLQPWESVGLMFTIHWIHGAAVPNNEASL